jgi:imidazolonepropionase
MAILITGIKKLVGTHNETKPLKGSQMTELPCIDNAYLEIENGLIAGYGPVDELQKPHSFYKETIDARERMIFPSWCDSHTHLVFAGSRESEFVGKIKGASYAEIAASGGGILNSARVLNNTSENQLFQESLKRLKEVMNMGTGAIEIKSGYGLSLESELKILRVIRKLKQSVSIPIKSTFLGAHAIPAEYKDDREGYVQLIINEMLPQVAGEKLADYIDVFCEEGFFSIEETEKILRAGKQYGLIPKIHANQLSVSGAVQAGIRCNALSVDHLECMDDAAITDLSSSQTIGTLLPTAAFFLRMPMQPARRMIDAGCTIALASDYNPGSSPSGNMNFVVSISCIQMKMLPEEAINAATINGAFAMGVQKEVGSFTIGKKANLIITKPIPSIAYLAYGFGNNLIENVMVAGEWLKEYRITNDE